MILKYYDMKLNKNDRKKCGIYCIRNIVNSKVYVGKAKDIYNRIQGHIYALRRKSKDENRHLINAWFKYGEDAFEYFVIEELEFDEEILKVRELYWIDDYKSTYRQFGYNLRKDSSTQMIVHEETKQLLSEIFQGENNPNYGNNWTYEQKEQMSKIKKEQYANGKVVINIEACKKGCKIRNENWEKDPTLKDKMKKRVSESITEYKFYQYDKVTGELLKIWDSVHDILTANPNWKRHNIYAACSGEKPSIYGYKWKKIKNEDIVQP